MVSFPLAREGGLGCAEGVLRFLIARLAAAPTTAKSACADYLQPAKAGLAVVAAISNRQAYRPLANATSIASPKLRAPMISNPAGALSTRGLRMLLGIRQRRKPSLAASFNRAPS